MQLISILSFFTQWHNELVTQCGNTTLAAWIFIGTTGRDMFEDLAKPRAIVSMVENWTSAEDKSHIIWAVLSVHARMKDIIGAGFKAHPVITTSMSNFLMTNRVDPTQIDDIVKKADATSKLASRLQVLEHELKGLKAAKGGKAGGGGGGNKKKASPVKSQD
jgi:hypothetical protein